MFTKNNYVIVTGETSSRRDKLIELGSRWNPFEKGWVFSSTKEGEVQSYVDWGFLAFRRCPSHFEINFLKQLGR